MDYEREDKIALHRALLALGTCPFCRAGIYPVGPDYPIPAEEYRCEGCDTIWPLAKKDDK